MEHRFNKQWALLLGGLALVTSAAAQPGRAPSGPDLDRAVSRARDQVPGRVLSAETRRQDGHPEHQIRILTPDGRVRRVYVDGESGQVSGPGSPAPRR
jgi:uncharacterized iron-regulated membrane protein